MMKISASSELSYASYEDLSLQRDEWVEDWDEFESAEESLGIEEPGECSKLLGWANPIQGNMTQQCELISRGYYLGHGWDDISPRDRQESAQWANRDWTLLFQLDCVTDSDFELAFVRENATPNRVMGTIFGIIMIIVYVGVGILLLINFFNWNADWAWTRYVVGVMLIIYGLFRAYRAAKGIK